MHFLGFIFCLVVDNSFVVAVVLDDVVVVVLDDVVVVDDNSTKDCNLDLAANFIKPGVCLKRSSGLISISSWLEGSTLSTNYWRDLKWIFGGKKVIEKLFHS